MNNTIVINGNGLDEEVLSEANLDEAETVLALTNDDEDNLMVSVLVEKFAKDQKDVEDKRTMALINKPNYSLLQSSLKIDDLIDPRMNTVSSILKHIHKGTIENAYTISNGEYEVIEAEIIESSELINKELKNSNLPDEIRIGAVLRDKKVIIPKSDFIFQKERRSIKRSDSPENRAIRSLIFEPTGLFLSAITTCFSFAKTSTKQASTKIRRDNGSPDSRMKSPF